MEYKGTGKLNTNFVKMTPVFRTSLIVLLFAVNSSGYLLSQELTRSFYGPTETFDEPQMSDNERIESFLANGQYPEQVAIDIAAVRRRPERGVAIANGIFSRVAMNNNVFELGYLPRLFLFIENQSGKVCRMDRHLNTLQLLKLTLHKGNTEIPPGTFYDYCQMLPLKRLSRIGGNLVQNNHELVFPTRIEDAFGTLGPGSYELDVQVNANGIFDNLEIQRPAPEHFTFKILSEHHKHGTNGLFDVYTLQKKEAEKWAKNENRKNVVAAQVVSTAQNIAPAEKLISSPQTIDVKTNLFPKTRPSTLTQLDDTDEALSQKRSTSMPMFLVAAGLLIALLGYYWFRQK